MEFQPGTFQARVLCPNEYLVRPTHLLFQQRCYAPMNSVPVGQRRNVNRHPVHEVVVARVLLFFASSAGNGSRPGGSLICSAGAHTQQSAVRPAMPSRRTKAMPEGGHPPPGVLVFVPPRCPVREANTHPSNRPETPTQHNVRSGSSSTGLCLGTCQAAA